MAQFIFSPLARRLDKKTIDQIVAKQLDEIRRRIVEYRDGTPLPNMTNRIVIIVDDGIATGSTIVPALKLCRARKVSKLIVAAPVSGKRYVSEIDELADEVTVVEMPHNFYAVEQVYKDFHGLSDKEVMDLLNDFKKIKSIKL
jgi:predicted phosphoribosyltransferase